MFMIIIIVVVVDVIVFVVVVVVVAVNKSFKHTDGARYGRPQRKKIVIEIDGCTLFRRERLTKCSVNVFF